MRPDTAVGACTQSMNSFHILLIVLFDLFAIGIPKARILPCRQRLRVEPATRRRPRSDDAGIELSVIACVIQATDTVGPAGRIGAGREGVECQSWPSLWHVDYASQAFED